MFSSTALLVSATLLMAPGGPVEAHELPPGYSPSEPSHQTKEGLPMFSAGVGLLALSVGLGSAAYLVLARNALGTPMEGVERPDPSAPLVMAGCALGALALGGSLLIAGLVRHSRAKQRLATPPSAARLRWTPHLQLAPRQATFGVGLHF